MCVCVRGQTPRAHTQQSARTKKNYPLLFFSTRQQIFFGAFFCILIFCIARRSERGHEHETKRTNKQTKEREKNHPKDTKPPHAGGTLEKKKSGEGKERGGREVLPTLEEPTKIKKNRSPPPRDTIFIVLPVHHPPSVPLSLSTGLPTPHSPPPPPPPPNTPTGRIRKPPPSSPFTSHLPCISHPLPSPLLPPAPPPPPPFPPPSTCKDELQGRETGGGKGDDW